MSSKPMHFAWWLSPEPQWRICRTPGGIQIRLDILVIWIWPLGDPVTRGL